MNLINKNSGKPASGQNEVRADIFSGFLAVFQSERVASAGGRKGDVVFALPPAEPVNEIGSDIFKYTPPVGKSCFWFALCEGSPADFRFKIKFCLCSAKRNARSGLFRILIFKEDL